MAFSAPVEDLEVSGGFEAPEEDVLASQDTGQSRLSSAGSGVLKGLGKFFTRGAEGAGGAVGMLSPINYLPKMGLKAPTLADRDSALAKWMIKPGEQIAEIGKAGTAAVDAALPTNPAYQKEFWAGQAPEAIGQVLGVLGETIATRGANTIPLIHSGLVGLASGYDEADRQGITDQNKRDAMAASFGLTEALVERLGGVGSKAFGKRLFDAASRKGGESFVKRFLKTATAEGGEESLTGELQDIEANIFGNENAPEWNPLDPDVLARRANEFALGTVAGGPAALVDAYVSSKPPVQSTEAPDGAVIQMGEGTPIDISGGFIAPEEDLVEASGILPVEARHRRDKAVRAMSNDELAENISIAQSFQDDPEWQGVAQHLVKEAERRGNQQVTNRQDFMDDGVPVDGLEDQPVIPDGTPIIPNLPELRVGEGFQEPPTEAELSAQVIEDALAEEERIRQSPEGRAALVDDLRSRETITPETPVGSPAKAVSSPPEASSTQSAVPTLQTPKDAPAAKETPSTAPPAAKAVDSVLEAEKQLKLAKSMSVSPSVIRHLEGELSKAQASAAQAKVPVTMPDGTKAEAPALVKGVDGLEPNLAPAATVAAEAAKVENAKIAAEKAAEEKKAEKAKSQSTEEKPVTYKMKEYNKTGRVGKSVELPIEQARAKLLQRQSLFNSLKNCLEGKS